MKDIVINLQMPLYAEIYDFNDGGIAVEPFVVRVEQIRLFGTEIWFNGMSSQTFKLKEQSADTRPLNKRWADKEETPSCPPRYCGTCMPSDCVHAQTTERDCEEESWFMSGKDILYSDNPLFNGHKPQPRERSPRGISREEKKQKYYDTIAVDFDGTLCEYRFPDIGKPKPLVIAFIKQHAARGTKIILHTCRENGTRRALLNEAVAWCAAYKIPLYAVNENPENTYPEQYGVSTMGRKVYADLYIDDKARSTADVESDMRLAMRIVDSERQRD